MITINGKTIETTEISLCAYLAEKGYNTQRIAVELNGKILPKAQYEPTLLKDGDRVEIVSFVGGG